MIQQESMLKIADNSGAKSALGIRVLGGPERRNGSSGDVVGARGRDRGGVEVAGRVYRGGSEQEGTTVLVERPNWPRPQPRRQGLQPGLAKPTARANWGCGRR